MEEDFPEGFKKLYEFQRKGIEFGVKNRGRLLIADEMGVGKTVQALFIAWIFRQDWPLLIICPATLRFTWQEEVIKWLGPNLSEQQVLVPIKGNQSIPKETKILILSYEFAAKKVEELEKKKFRAVIADEAHYLKNGLSKRAQALVPFLQITKRIILLTGTPAFSKPRELYNLCFIIRPEIFKFFKDFGQRYCDPKPSKWSGGVDYDGCSNAKELGFVLSSSFMIRRLKTDVLPELPDKTRQKVNVECNQDIVKEIREQRAKLAQYSLSIEDTINNIDGLPGRLTTAGGFGDSSEAFDQRVEMNTILNKCFLLTGQAKIASSCRFIRELLENDMKILVFGHHIEVLDRIQDCLESNNIQFVRIDGRTEMSVRQRCVEMFESNMVIKVALLSLTAASHGLTLTSASVVVFAEMHWTPALMIQAEDRCHRITQKSNVTCFYLYGENTIDDILYEKVQKKFNLVTRLLDGAQSESKGQEPQAGLEESQSASEHSTQKSNGSQPFFKSQGSDFWYRKGAQSNFMYWSASQSSVYGNQSKKYIPNSGFFGTSPFTKGFLSGQVSHQISQEDSSLPTIMEARESQSQCKKFSPEQIQNSNEIAFIMSQNSTHSIGSEPSLSQSKGFSKGGMSREIGSGKNSSFPSFHSHLTEDNLQQFDLIFSEAQKEQPIQNPIVPPSILNELPQLERKDERWKDPPKKQKEKFKKKKNEALPSNRLLTDFFGEHSQDSAFSKETSRSNTNSSTIAGSQNNRNKLTETQRIEKEAFGTSSFPAKTRIFERPLMIENKIQNTNDFLLAQKKPNSLFSRNPPHGSEKTKNCFNLPHTVQKPQIREATDSTLPINIISLVENIEKELRGKKIPGLIQLDESREMIGDSEGQGFGMKLKKKNETTKGIAFALEDSIGIEEYERIWKKNANRTSQKTEETGYEEPSKRKSPMISQGFNKFQMRGGKYQEAVFSSQGNFNKQTTLSQNSQRNLQEDLPFIQTVSNSQKNMSNGQWDNLLKRTLLLEGENTFKKEENKAQSIEEEKESNDFMFEEIPSNLGQLLDSLNEDIKDKERILAKRESASQAGDQLFSGSKSKRISLNN